MNLYILTFPKSWSKVTQLKYLDYIWHSCINRIDSQTLVKQIDRSNMYIYIYIYIYIERERERLDRQIGVYVYGFILDKVTDIRYKDGQIILDDVIKDKD